MRSFSPYRFFAGSRRLALLELVLVLVIVGVFVPPVLAEDEALNVITLEDLVSVERLGPPVLSPDGSELAIVIDGQIHLMPTRGGWPAKLTTSDGGKSALAFSPDGELIAFASRGSIWVVAVAGGQPRRLTHVSPGPGDPRRASDRSPRWSPSGEWILFETGRRGNSDLMVVSRDGNREGFLKSTEADELNPAWAPDGKRLSYTERTVEHFSGKLKLLSFDELTGKPGKTAELHTAPTDLGGGWAIPRAGWSPDGSELAVILQHEGWDHIYRIPAKGGKPVAVTRGESENTDPKYSPDGRSLAFVSNRANREERHVWTTALEGGEPRRLSSPSVGPGVEQAPQWSADGRQIFFMRSTPHTPENFMMAEASGGAEPLYVTQRLPRNFTRARFPMPEEVHFQGNDGLEIAAMLYKPPGFETGKRYPAVLWIHGGPEGQDVFNWDPWALMLTQQGYLVLQPNYRGSRGYGEAFRNLNVEDSGGGEMHDVAAGARYLVDQGLADRDRLGIGGGSHGGTMVAYAVTKYPDLFKVALELFGVTDRESYIERTNRGSAIRWIMKMGGTPAEKPEVYWQANILLDVDKIQTPLLVMHGEEDPQVPPNESAQFVRELKKKGKTHLYVTYAGEPHGFRQREHRLDAWTKQLAFLRKYLDPEYGRAITSTEEFVLERR